MSIPESRMSFSVEGKVAVATGGGTGIGRDIALELAKNGADVAVSGRRTAPLEEVAEEIKALGKRSITGSTDISMKSDVDELAA